MRIMPKPQNLSVISCFAICIKPLVNAAYRPTPYLEQGRGGLATLFPLTTYCPALTTYYPSLITRHIPPCDLMFSQSADGESQLCFLAITLCQRRAQVVVLPTVACLANVASCRLAALQKRSRKGAANLSEKMRQGGILLSLP